MGKDMSLLPEDLGALFELDRDPALGVDESGKILFINPAAAALFGLESGDSAWDAVPEDILADPSERFMAAFRTGRRSFTMSVTRMGGVSVCKFSPAAVLPPAPAQTSALQTLSATLMNVRMAIDALVCRTRAEEDPALEETTQTLYREYHRMLRSCRHMAMAAGIQGDSLPFTPRCVDLAVLCRDMCDTVGRLIEDMGIAITFRVDEGLLLTMADVDLLESMLANLLTNSITHCHSGDTIRVGLSRLGDRFILAVEDPGSGISPEKLASVLSPEGMNDEAGAGLGLFLARGIAERHGGSMILESRPGRGLAVRISIPYKQTGDMTLNSPMTRYRADGMDRVLTELSVFLDKKYYTRKYFD